MSLFWSPFPSRYQDSTMANYAATSADQAQSAAHQAQDATRDVQERLDQLLLVCAAMWELLREKTGISEEELITRIAEVDVRDGVADGKLTYTPKKCPKCGRTVFPRHQRCLYCGFDVPVDSVFKSI